MPCPVLVVDVHVVLMLLDEGGTIAGVGAAMDAAAVDEVGAAAAGVVLSAVKYAGGVAPGSVGTLGPEEDAIVSHLLPPFCCYGST